MRSMQFMWSGMLILVIFRVWEKVSLMMNIISIHVMMVIMCHIMHLGRMVYFYHFFIMVEVANKGSWYWGMILVILISLLINAITEVIVFIRPCAFWQHDLHIQFSFFIIICLNILFLRFSVFNDSLILPSYS